MGDSKSTVAQGIAPFLGRFFLGILTCALVGLALAFVFTLVWDPECERDCDVLSVLCVAGGLLLGVFVGLFVAISDRGRHSRGALMVLVWASAVASVTIVLALLLGVADHPAPVS